MFVKAWRSRTTAQNHPNAIVSGYCRHSCEHPAAPGKRSVKLQQPIRTAGPPNQRQHREQQQQKCDIVVVSGHIAQSLAHDTQGQGHRGRTPRQHARANDAKALRRYGKSTVQPSAQLPGRVPSAGVILDVVRCKMLGMTPSPVSKQNGQLGLLSLSRVGTQLTQFLCLLPKSVIKGRRVPLKLDGCRLSPMQSTSMEKTLIDSSILLF